MSLGGPSNDGDGRRPRAGGGLVMIGGWSGRSADNFAKRLVELLPTCERYVVTTRHSDRNDGDEATRGSASYLVDARPNPVRPMPNLPFLGRDGFVRRAARIAHRH